MKIKTNSIIPFGKFRFMNFYGVIHTRKNYIKISPRTWNHEKIHDKQAREICGWKPIGYSLYYILYCILWVISFILPPYNKAYHQNALEREAYLNDCDFNYLKNRKKFAWLRSKQYWKLKM